MIEELAKALEPKGIKLKPLARNPVDRVWGTRAPGAAARRPSIPHPLKYAGKPAEQKIAELQATLRKDGAGRGHPDAARFDRLAVQHPRLRRGAQSGGAGVRDRAGERQAGAVHRSAPRSAPRPRRIWPALAKISEPAALERRLAALKKAGKRIRLDPGDGRELVLPQAQGRQGAHRARAPIPACCPRRARTPPRSRARAPPTSATAPRVARFLAWLDREAPTGSARRDRAPRASSRPCAARRRR